MAVKTQIRVAQELAATKSRNFRTFLLMQQFAAHEIGERIKLARKERGLTQDELAAMASFSKRSLQDYEYGKTIPYKHLRELARLLNRPEEWFLYGDAATGEPADLSDLREEVSELRGMVGELLALQRGLEPEAPAQSPSQPQRRGASPGSRRQT